MKPFFIRVTGVLWRRELFYTFVDRKSMVQSIQEKVEPGFYRIKESVQDKVYGKTGKESIDALVL